MKGYRRTLFMGMIFIALGVVFSTALSESSGSLGTVLIAVGGLFFISGMSKKRKEDEAGKTE